MSKLNGGYLGGSTTLSPKDHSWFTKKSMRVPHEPSGPRPEMSPAERKEFEMLSASSASPRLLHPSDVEIMRMSPKERARARKKMARKNRP